jgi:Family of unknown function (DUF5519)
MTRIAGAMGMIRRAVLEWEGVTDGPHRFGGIEFRLGRRELGHLHGDFLLDIPFPLKVRDELVAAHNVKPHHILPESGWISFEIKNEPDVARAIALLRRSYELAAKSKEKIINHIEEKNT